MISKVFEESREEIERILNEETIGYLGLSVDDTPLVVPLNYVYIEGKILFHCALTGKKLEYIRRNDSVCFTVARQSGTIEQHEENNPCLIHSESVMCFGNARIIEELPERHNALNIFNKRFIPDADEVSLKRTKHCLVVEIKINMMTGRREVNQKRNYWEYRFSG